MTHMVESIKEVNSVTQIPTTTIRILLNHFKWDKEKLMERFYSDDQEEMFQEAQVMRVVIYLSLISHYFYDHFLVHLHIG